jgi:hypothetical protein
MKSDNAPVDELDDRQIIGGDRHGASVHDPLGDQTVVLRLALEGVEPASEMSRPLSVTTPQAMGLCRRYEGIFRLFRTGGRLRFGSYPNL